MQPSRTYSWLALGDSYTIGESVSEQDRWTSQLVELAGKADLTLKVKTIAQTGWTTSELSDAITREQIKGSFDFVSLLIGVNNQYRGESLKQYQAEFKALLEQAIKYAGGRRNHVFVLSIPDYGVTPFGSKKDPVKIRKEIDEFNRINYMKSLLEKVNYVNITDHSRKAMDNPALISTDDLHPSQLMYKYWAAELKARLDLIFEKK